MSTIKSSAENLTLNADGANNDIKFQSNGSEVASLDQAGVFTATSFSGGGSTPSIVDGGNATAINIDSSENVGIGHPLSQHQQRLVVKKTAAITSLGGGGGINIVNEQGAGNFANLRFTGSNQNCYLGYRDGANDQDRRFSIGVGADAEHFSFSQAGLKFNGDTAAANALDDYEEGTWTATIHGASVSGGTLLGYYTKIGNLVHASVYVQTTFSSVSGTASMSGLPYSMANLNHHYGVASYVHGSAATGIQNFYLDYSNNRLYPIATNAVNTVSWQAGSKALMLSVTYRSA